MPWWWRQCWLKERLFMCAIDRVNSVGFEKFFKLKFILFLFPKTENEASNRKSDFWFGISVINYPCSSSFMEKSHLWQNCSYKSPTVLTLVIDMVIRHLLTLFEIKTSNVLKWWKMPERSLKLLITIWLMNCVRWPCLAIWMVLLLGTWVVLILVSCLEKKLVKNFKKRKIENQV